ncbi:TolC family protein [Candidatus Poribacteria bacterium]|nr:TolC family protein [Candidatus Poribacteria bacterium]
MNRCRFRYSIWVGTFLLILQFSIPAQEYNELTLEDSLEIAQTDNLAIQSAKQKLIAAKSQINLAQSALLPRLSANGNYTYFKDIQKSVIQADGGFGFPTPGQQGEMNQMDSPDPDNEADLIELEFGAHHNVQGTLNLTQPIFAWGRIYNNYKAAKIGYSAVEEELTSAYESLRLTVYEAFYRVLIAQEFVKVAKQSVELVELQLMIAENSFAAGVTTNFDVLRAKVQLANAKSQLIQAKNRVQTAKDSYKNILNIPLAQDISVKGSFQIQLIENKLDELISIAMTHRPEVKQSNLNEQIGEKQLSIAKTQNLPDLAFFSNYQISHSERLTEMNRIWSLGLQINVPIFDGFASRAGVKQSESTLRQIELSSKQIKSSVEFEVRSSYLALLEAKTLIDVQKETVAQAEASVSLANLQFKSGIITTVELTDAQLALLQANVNRLQAQHDYVVGLAKLEKAIGQRIQ